MSPGIRGWLFLLLGLPLVWSSQAQTRLAEADVLAIRQVMQKQEVAWNRGDVAAFMDGYWPSDSLRFVTKNGVTYGWENMLQRYRESYPDATAMGQLTFTIKHVDGLASDVAHVTGRWHLKRDAGDLSGSFTLVWKRFDGTWLIVSDHSS